MMSEEMQLDYSGGSQFLVLDNNDLYNRLKIPFNDTVV